MGEIPYDKRGDFYDSYSNVSVVKMQSNLYYASRNYRRQLYVLNEDERVPKLVKDFGYESVSSKFYEINENLYFFVIDDHPDVLELHMCNADQEVSQILSHDNPDYLRSFYQHNENLFYEVEKEYREILFKFNTHTQEQDTLYQSTGDLRFINVFEEGLLFIEHFTPSIGNVILLDHNGVKTILANDSYQYVYDPYLVPTSDTLNWYVRNNFNSDSVHVVRINRNTFETSTITANNIQEIHPTSNNECNVRTEGYSGGFFKGEFVNDSLIIGAEMKLKSELLNKNHSYSLESGRNKIYSIVDHDLGIELGVVNQNDSIELIKDLNEGEFSSVPFRYCSIGGTPSYNTAFFEHDNKSYAFLSNGNDESVYLYEVRPDSLVSLSKAPEFNSSRVRILPYDDYIYYITQNSQSELSKVYRWKWNAVVNPQPTNRSFDSETWYTEIGFDHEGRVCVEYADNLRSQNTIIDNAGATYVSFTNNQYGGLREDNIYYDLASKSRVKNRISDVYAKYDKYGELQWMKGIGSYYKLFSDYDQFSLDSEGNVHVYGVLYNEGYFDSDTLALSESNRYWAKLDSETGDVTDIKILYKTTFTDDPEFFKVEVDGEDNFYMSGKYNDYELDLNDTILLSDWTHQSFLAKYDDEGNFIWAKNVLTNWSDFIGDIRSIELNKETKEILVYCSQNRSWSCATDSWGGVLIVYDFDGNEKQRLVISGNSLHYNGVATQLNDGKVLVKGLSSGVIQTDIYEFQNEIGNECFEVSEYTLIYDQKQNRVLRANVTTDNQGMVPLQVKKDENYIYFMGEDFETKNTMIQRYSLDGEYKGKKLINQRAWEASFDVKDGFFVLTGPSFSADSEYPISDTWRYSPVLSVLKFEIDDWVLTPQTIRPMDVRNVDENLNLNVYPNPFTSTFEINFQDMEFDFENYKIVNAMGQLIQEGKVLDQNFLKIDLTGQRKGVYFINLYGEDESKTAKLIKL
ncbi:T9SS type A sorting domain-containing protein [Brumimicrobium mesophilum]|uniref:T9SS type A sorting domain-containing protein n=1 Tax=Brumimicrobium mesophilum TaxID=392717 RepID=UPI00131CBA5F|nr:T9SS type A sorting domain-containing protein [Brumimicrobium mesophilum]